MYTKNIVISTLDYEHHLLWRSSGSDGRQLFIGGGRREDID